VHFLEDGTIIVETCGLSVEDLTGNKVQDHTCGQTVEDLIFNKVLVKTCVASGRAEGLTCVFVAASWS